MPIPLVVAPAVAAALTWLSRFLLARLAAYFIGGLIYLGVYLGVEHFVIGPILDQIQYYATATLVGVVADWARFLNVDKFISMIISAYSMAGTIRAARVAFFKK